MNKTYCIIGTGRQGTAAAYDLLMYANISKLLLMDNNQESIDACMRKLDSFKSKNNIVTSIIDFNDMQYLKDKLKEVDIFLSSVPYKYNLMLTEIALETCC